MKPIGEACGPADGIGPDYGVGRSCNGCGGGLYGDVD